jgi:PleD family two-component response regulator
MGDLSSTALPPVDEVPGRILVVDDEPMVRARITRVLTAEGYEVVSVADRQAALDVVRNADVPFDLVITNILHVE